MALIMPNELVNDTSNTGLILVLYDHSVSSYNNPLLNGGINIILLSLISKLLALINPLSSILFNDISLLDKNGSVLESNSIPLTLNCSTTPVAYKISANNSFIL